MLSHGVLRRGENAPERLRVNCLVYPNFPAYSVKSDRKIGPNDITAIGPLRRNTTTFLGKREIVKRF
jgi:hypothetical protein